MRASRFATIRLSLALSLPIAVAACAPAPIYKAGPSVVATTPQQVATSPNNFAQAQVIWGGEVIGVDNLPNSTEIRVLAYPLDSSQRPRLKQTAQGRFTAVVPGFLDPMNFPAGSLVTVLGKVDGTSVGQVGQATYTYPMVRVQRSNLHRWTADEMRQGHPNVSFGVGVGTWIH